METLDVQARLGKANVFLTKELSVLELGSKIQSQVREGIDKSQREYFLREQLKAIQKELGEKDERTAEIDELRQRLIQAKLPPEAMKEAERELDRLAKMPPAAAEYTVVPDLPGMADRPSLGGFHRGQPGYFPGPEGPG